MKGPELLTLLSGLNVQLWVEGDQLRYRAPKEVLTAELRDLLQKNKKEVTELLVQKARETVSSHPLSYVQRALWFVHQAIPNSASYNVAFSARIRSKVDVSALKGVFQTLMDRHPALRTTYSDDEGVPIQHVHGYMQADFSEADASHLSEEQLKEAVAEAYQRPIDLKLGPVFRTHLFNRSEQDHVLLMVAHHIAVDGWSIWLLLDEMRSLYASQLNGRAASLSIPGAKYTDYVRWQAEMLAGTEGSRLWVYWKKQLEGDLSPLGLPGYRSRMPAQRIRGASHVFAINEQLTRQIKAFARAEGITLFMLMLTAYQILLYRYTGQQDILVSSPVSGRSRPEFEGIVGCFINPVVFRAKMSDGLTFRGLLAETQRTVLSALEHQDYPFALLTQQLRLTGDLGRSPLFQVDFVLQKPQRSDDISAVFGTGIDVPLVNFGGLELESFYLPQQEGQLDLTLEMAEGNGLLWGVLKYNTDLFDVPAIERMSGHFRTVLESALADPTQPISDLRILTDAEHRQLITEWSQTRSGNTNDPSRSDLGVHLLFESEVERAPHAPAVIFNGKQLTYRELNEQANRLAHYLQKKGVGPEVIVGIYMERSLEVVVAVLAALKAGGAYLPLDPMYPTERLMFMLEDSQLSVLLTYKSMATHLPVHGAQLVYLDADEEAISQESGANPASLAKAENLAYVIYTSGSTGQAKGVMVTHHNLTNAFFAWEEAYDLRSVSSHLQMASFSFDVFAGDLVRALCSGGKLVISPRDLLLDSEQLYRLMCQAQIDCAEFVPVVLRELIHYLEVNEKRLDFMRLLICGSDSWYMEEYYRFSRVCGPQTRLINSYGVTEATIDSSYFENANLDFAPDQLVPIGRPIANTQLYVLDSNLQPTPIGVPGELCIGGAGLARGYLNRPELTAKKFIPSPFSDKQDARLYKTGDLCRYRSDGNIELLGRVDFQVKIRGFRVEIGEVESVLGQHPAVSQNAVTAMEDAPGNKRLVAYVVANHQSTLSVNDLRSFLKEKLPHYMLPSAFVLMDRLPLTPNGKVDRRALPAPEIVRPELDTGYVAPRNEMERTIASAWQEVLKVEKVGIHDNFFDLGGHSLMTTQLHSRLRDAFAIDLPLRHLFEATTVAEQGQLIDTLLWVSHRSEARGESSVESREEIEI